MRKATAFILLITTLTIFVAGCDQMHPSPETFQKETTQEENADELRQFLVDNGFRVDMIEDRGDHFLVEGDIRFTKEGIKQRIESEKKRAEAQVTVADTLIGADSARFDQAVWPDREMLVSIDNVNSATYEFHSSVPASWRSAFRSAASEWNAVSESQVSLSEVNSNADISVMMDSGLPSYTVARGDWPMNRQPGDQITINPDYNYYGFSQKKFVMVHEIGHNLGLRHTNWQSRGEAQATTLPFTPSSDPNSVMNGGTGGNSWNGFSSYDEIAAVMLYPEEDAIGIGEITSFRTGEGEGRCPLTIYFDPPENAGRVHIMVRDANDDDWRTITYFADPAKGSFTFKYAASHAQYYRMYGRPYFGHFTVPPSETKRFDGCQ